jgi:threonine synthase
MLDQRDWLVPDWIVLPGGNLGNVSAFGKGLRELLDLGLIDRLPRLAVIQAAGSAPFYDPFNDYVRQADKGHVPTVKKPETLATAINLKTAIDPHAKAGLTVCPVVCPALFG